MNPIRSGPLVPLDLSGKHFGPAVGVTCNPITIHRIAEHQNPAAAPFPLDSPSRSKSPAMFLTSPSLQLSSSLKALPSPFLHGSFPAIPFLPKLPPFSLSPAPAPLPPSLLSVKAMKKMQGRVVCATNDKTVAVEVVRLAPHPKYKRRIRKKKKYQAHDPSNQFKVGDFVELEKSRPISKSKTFIAVPVTSRNVPKPIEPVPADLGLPLQSQQQE